MFIGRWGSATVKRYIGEALSDRASTAPRIAVGRSSPMCPATVTAEVLLEMKEILARVKAAAGSSGPESDGARVDRLMAEARKAAEKVVPEVAMEAIKQREDALGAVVRLRTASTFTAKTHLIAIGDGSLPTDTWTAFCGWHFGAAPHRRTVTNEVNCKKCLRASRQIRLEG